MPAHHDRARRTPARVADRPTWLISRVHARSTATLFGAFDEHGAGLRGYHFRLLAALEQWGPASQADLGRDTGIDRSDVTQVLGELEARGLVDRAPDPDHRRRNIVTITPAGLAELERLGRVIDDAQKAVLAPLTAAEQGQFLGLLRRLLEAPEAE